MQIPSLRTTNTTNGASKYTLSCTQEKVSMERSPLLCYLLIYQCIQSKECTKLLNPLGNLRCNSIFLAPMYVEDIIFSMSPARNTLHDLYGNQYIPYHQPGSMIQYMGISISNGAPNTAFTLPGSYASNLDHYPVSSVAIGITIKMNT